MISKRKNETQHASATPAKKARPARKLFEPEVRPLDAGVSPLLPVRRPRRITRPLAVLAIGVGLLGAALGQESNRLAYTVVRTNAAGSPEQVLPETNAAVEDVVVVRQEADLGANGGPIIVPLPQEPQGPPPATQEPATGDSGIRPEETASTGQPGGQVQSASKPQPQPAAAPATSGVPAVAAQEREAVEHSPSRSEYRDSRRRDGNRTNTVARAERKEDNAAGKTVEDFSAFRMVAERNIFNPNRRYYRPGEARPKPKQVDSFGLVGVMSYEKGIFAFFDGSGSDFKKVLKASDKIANYTIAGITPNAVKLENGGKELELRVGAQLRREDQGEWKLSNEAQIYAASAAGSSNAGASAPNASASAAPETPSGAEPDIIKRLMQRRDQE